MWLTGKYHYPLHSSQGGCGISSGTDNVWNVSPERSWSIQRNGWWIMRRRITVSRQCSTSSSPQLYSFYNISIQESHSLIHARLPFIRTRGQAGRQLLRSTNSSSDFSSAVEGGVCCSSVNKNTIKCVFYIISSEGHLLHCWNSSSCEFSTISNKVKICRLFPVCEYKVENLIKLPINLVDCQLVNESKCGKEKSMHKSFHTTHQPSV